MGKANKTRKFAQVKRMINPKDARLSVNQKSKDIYKRGKDQADTSEKNVTLSKLNNVRIKEMEK